MVVDDKASMREMLRAAFEERGLSVTTASDGIEAIDLMAKQTFDAIVTDLSMPGKDGIEVLKAAKSVSPDTPVFIVTAYGTIDTAVEAMRLGACDFVAKPFNLAELELKLDKALRTPPSAARIGGRLGSARPPMAGDSSHTKQVLRMIEKIGPSRSSVLITGPSGTGKELVARAIHDASPRREQPFVALNCAALAPGVLESELFGHEKGAFTGAVERGIGRFERAHNGTLFLDEVGEIDPSIQVKLLRVLQDGVFERVGAKTTTAVDVRIVAATNKDLREAILAGAFREDFFYRLNVFSIQLEPLKNRRDDIPALVDHFLGEFCVETGKDVTDIDDDVMAFFMSYPWPGNVRELENVIERAVVLAEGESVTRDDLPQDMLFYREQPEPESGLRPEAASLVESTGELESELIRGALEKFRWNKTKAAEHLGLKRTTLQYKIRKYGLE
ncbi:MAG TPA: sigma-54-dependent Fis family transcriptional regulator [Candidatus Hydrogenedentes bacterium]|nr:sigma-54-dependent Fis family transcriptional regulator [Candidatus Hydrogenedentota bacterium]